MSRSTIPSKRPADAQEAAWIADEDRFVLQQAKKKAVIRVRGGRAQPIDWLTVTLAVIDPERNPLDDELGAADLDVLDPECVFEDLDHAQLMQLEKAIDTYLALEMSRSNQEYWNMMKQISTGRREQLQSTQPTARGVGSVTSDLDKLLGPKTFEELEKLEKQINAKLSSDEAIDTDYWQHLLRSLLTYKARAKLRKISKSLVQARIVGLRNRQTASASTLSARVGSLQETDLDRSYEQDESDSDRIGSDRHHFDPEPLLRLRTEDKSLPADEQPALNAKITEERRKVLKRGYIPEPRGTNGARSSNGLEPNAKRLRIDTDEASSSFDREVARGLSENEEIFTTEEPVTTKNLTSWSHQYPPRKPKYFNRVLRGYEWNKYNQTHYDHDNPPPRVVQGYKFNVFFPDLVDKTRAPTYRIERENGRKRGQTFAPAGEDDTCLIRFTAGPPYEDVAFRIVDREWDYSAKRERGFRSSFDKGILQLHFQFKKIYYRK